MIWRKSRAGRYYAQDEDLRLWGAERYERVWIVVCQGRTLATRKSYREARSCAETLALE